MLHGGTNHQDIVIRRDLQRLMIANSGGWMVLPRIGANIFLFATGIWGDLYRSGEAFQGC
jgi:hypothetical protein